MFSSVFQSYFACSLDVITVKLDLSPTWLQLECGCSCSRPDVTLKIQIFSVFWGDDHFLCFVLLLVGQPQVALGTNFGMFTVMTGMTRIWLQFNLILFPPVSFLHARGLTFATVVTFHCRRWRPRLDLPLWLQHYLYLYSWLAPTRWIVLGLIDATKQHLL